MWISLLKHSALLLAGCAVFESFFFLSFSRHILRIITSNSSADVPIYEDKSINCAFYCILLSQLNKTQSMLASSCVGMPATT